MTVTLILTDELAEFLMDGVEASLAYGVERLEACTDPTLGLNIVATIHRYRLVRIALKTALGQNDAVQH